MLLELQVSNFAIIDHLHIRFRPGLNILSGETGAGKSVLLKSLALMMGAKGGSEMIRSGSKTAVIEGAFDLSKRSDLQERLEEMGIDLDEEPQLIVRRVLSQGDKSRVYLNGSLSTLSALKELIVPMIEVTGQTAPLIEMTGQHDNRHLLSKAYHLDLIDMYCGAMDLRAEYEEVYTQLSELKREIARLEEESKTRAQRLDFLKFQRDEIRGLDLKEGELESIEADLKKLKSLAKIEQFAALTEERLYADDNSGLSLLHSVLQKAEELASVDADIAKKVEPLYQAKTLIEEVVFDLRNYVGHLDGDASKLDFLESRMSEIRKIQKKFGSSIEDILVELEKMETEIEEIEGSDEKLGKLSKQLHSLQQKALGLSTQLHQKRSQSSGLLAKSVNAELADLNMKGVRFLVQVDDLGELGPQGRSLVEFMTQSSAKDPARPLAKAASGGELSRILLSLKRVVGISRFPRTYLFDEVDTGVSGPTAEKVGRKLHSIGRGQQVICVTHLPQVAAFGDHHFYIQKNPADEGVSMCVEELSTKQRIKEIARLISGEKISKTSMAHAQELLEQSQESFS